MRALAVAALLGGCWSATGAAPATTTPTVEEPPAPSSAWRVAHAKSPCEQTVDHGMDVIGEQLAREAPVLAQHIDEVHRAIIEACVETVWSPEVLACIDDATDLDRTMVCVERLTTDQQKDLVERMKQASTPSRP